MPHEVVWSWWHLMLTFDLESYVHIFSCQAILFEWLYLATSVLVWRYIFRISRSRYSFKVKVTAVENGSMQVENYWSGLIGISVMITLKVIWSFWHFHLEIHFRLISVQAASSQFLNLAASFSVWRYSFRISRSSLSLNTMGLISRTALQCLGHLWVWTPWG